jgi:hypothetical protein
MGGSTYILVLILHINIKYCIFSVTYYKCSFNITYEITALLLTRQFHMH